MVNKTDFEQLFRQYYSILCKVAYGYIRDRMVVEEIVNDVFVRYWSKQSQLVIHSELKDYLCTSTKNACIDYIRTNQKRHAQTVYIDEQEIVCATLADLGEDPLDYIINSETEHRIRQALAELPERYRLTVTLNRIDGLSYDEVAEKMSITKNTVKSNLRDAMTILREKLKDLKFLLLL